MQLCAWEKLPKRLRIPAVRPYYDFLLSKQNTLRLKRVLDVAGSAALLTLFAAPMGMIALLVRAQSPGPAIFCQRRITQYGRPFWIFKFRTMKMGAAGSAVTLHNDPRITGVGRILRRTRLDELPQLFNILLGDMSFVGTRPEVPKFVRCYKGEMLATLLLPAGLTSEASIAFQDEARLLPAEKSSGQIYLENILPCKMRYNLQYLKKISLREDLTVLLKTLGVWKKDSPPQYPDPHTRRCVQ